MSHAPIPAKLRYAAEQAGVLMAQGAATWGQTQLPCRELAKEVPNLDQIGTNRSSQYRASALQAFSAFVGDLLRGLPAGRDFLNAAIGQRFDQMF